MSNQPNRQGKMVLDFAYPAILIGSFSAALIFLLSTAVWLLREILVELREIRETIRNTALSDIELRLFGNDGD
jgi:hypothetical protein